ncbi:MAG: choice-of-anchor L domain-containing protein [Flavobacteriales bacterium]|nr:choice-of-anchor L domain-containing protein [Flavobacteriales bacterium]
MKGIILAFLILFITLFSRAQLTISNSAPDSLIQNVLVGSGVKVSDIKLIGSSRGIASFSDTKETIGLPNGIFLSTGRAREARGPNTSNTRSGILTATMEPVKDKDLVNLARGNIFDKTAITFDFIPEHEHLSFSFVFGSEEYPEYVNSQFNDVFAFVIEDESGNKTNLATLPDRKTPITVNSINQFKNAEYYIANFKRDIKSIGSSENNKLRYYWFKKQYGKYPWEMNRDSLERYSVLRKDYEFDGFTTVLTIEEKLIPNHKYKFKIAIADVGDKNLDSGVFIKGGSFSSFKSSILSTAIVKVNSEVNQKPQALKPKTLIVYFENDQHTLNQQEERKLVQFLDSINHNDILSYSITGHTDSIGSDVYNQRLSNKRIESVQKHLHRMNISSAKITKHPKGERVPQASNTSHQGRAKNRRVHIEIYYKEEHINTDQ